MSAGWDVLVVDDEEVVREGVARVLSAHGLRVAGAADAAAALAHPAASEARMVLCDLMLPGEPGLALLARLRALRPGRPLVAITGYTTAEAVDGARAAGASGFLGKPFDEDELLSVVGEALGRAVPAKEGQP